MAGRVCVLVSLLCLFYYAEAQTSKIKLTVGTMSACGDTVRFMSQHLVPTFDQYEDFLEVEFVPWGRSAIVDGEIICRFGVNDCWANRMQRCALNVLKGNSRKIMDFMTCEFTLPLPGYSKGSYECAIAAGLNIVNLDHCVNNPQNDNLDEDARIASIEPMSVINFIPYILVNDVVDLNANNQAYTRLSSFVCFLLAEDPSSGIDGCQL